MSERLRLTPVSGGREIAINVTAKEQFHAGGETAKYRVAGISDRRRVSYVERPYSAKVVTSWQRFRNAGLPVVPELYRGTDGGLYADDLQADGSRIYGKSLLAELSQPGVHEPHPADARFVALMHSDQKTAIEDQIGKYVRMANEYGLTLPIDDAFDLIVHPNRHDNPWELIILDLAQAGTYDPFDIDTPHTVDDARSANRRRGDASFGYLKVLRQRLRAA